MAETQRIIESIIFSFKEEMSIIEQENIFAIISGGNRPTPQEMYARQKKIEQKRTQYENALRRILWRALGTVEEQRQMLSSAAEKAVDEALEKLADKLNGYDGFTSIMDF